MEKKWNSKSRSHKVEISKIKPNFLYQEKLTQDAITFNFHISNRYELVREYVFNKIDTFLNEIPKLNNKQRNDLREIFIYEVVNRMENDHWAKIELDNLGVVWSDSTDELLKHINDITAKEYLFPLINKVFHIPQMVSYSFSGKLKELKLLSRKASIEKNILEKNAIHGEKFRGHQVSNENKDIYIPIFKLYLKYQEQTPKKKLREAVWNTAKYYPGYDNEEDKQRLYKRFNKFINNHNIKTLEQLKTELFF